MQTLDLSCISIQIIYNVNFNVPTWHSKNCRRLDSCYYLLKVNYLFCQLVSLLCMFEMSIVYTIYTLYMHQVVVHLIYTICYITETYIVAVKI